MAQLPKSGAGNHRAAGCPWMKTVVEPLLMIGGGGAGGGGWAIPGGALIAPVQTTVHPTWAAGRPSITTGIATHIGHVAEGPITPLGTSWSWVIGSVSRAAGNIVSPRLDPTVHGHKSKPDA